MKQGDIARRFARAKLHYGHGTFNASEEAAWLVSRVTDPRRLESIVQRRIRERVPLAYLLKEAWLGEHAFYVDRRVIVPRSFIAELLRGGLGPWLTKEPRSVLDLCTGSGCLAILAALEFRRARVDASDVSGDALAVAKKNIQSYGLRSRVRPVRSNLFEKLKTYDLIVSNPPYVTARSMRKLPEEYRHEPPLALAAGSDGLDLVHPILGQAKQHLNPGGLLVCEIGGNRRALERAYPRLEFAWPEVSDPGTVFILRREQLPIAARTPRASAAPPRRARARQ